MEDAKINNRDLALDLCRAVAIFLVIMQHSWSMLDLHNDAYGLICYLYRAVVHWGVPLFVMVSGSLLLSRPCSAKNFYKKRLTRILLPFLFWALVVYIVGIITHKYEDIHSGVDALLYFIPYLLENKIQMFHWFVHMILVLYVLTPFLQRALSLSSKRLVGGLLIVWALVLILRHAYPSLYCLRYVSSLTAYLGIYIAGYYIKQYIPATRCVMWGAVAGMVIFYIVDIVLKTQYYFVELFTTICVFTLLSKLPLSSNILMRTWVVPLSRYSYTIYLTHVPLIAAFYLLISKIDLLHPLTILPAVAVLPLITAIIVIVLCFIACKIFDRCPWVNNNFIGLSK